MNIEFYCPIWGSENMPFDDFCLKASNAGYNGVEMSLPLDKTSMDSILSSLKDAGLKLIAQHWETENPDPKIHAAEYEARLRNLASARPVFINSQTGRDFFNFEDNLALIVLAAQISDETGVNIIHETHRSKLSFAAHITRQFLEKMPSMRLTLDISHWFCVHERFLSDQEEALNMAIKRSDHIHARIGHTQGSQVTDYRIPEWEDSLNIHLDIWDRIHSRAVEEGRKTLTVTPEFGPAPYMLSKPGTALPLANQWELNTEMMVLLKTRWETD